MKELSVEEWLFVGAYLRDRNGANAIRAAINYQGKRAGETAWEWLQRPHIKAELARTFAARKADVGLTTEMIRNDIVNVLNADPRELFNIQTGACRYCHGIDHQSQRTKGEMDRDRYAWEMDPTKEGKPFPLGGGIGFDAYADPHPECPECNGKGLDRIRLTDTRTLSPEAACLLLSIEQTKHGVKITTRSKDAAREAAAKLLGINKETVEVTGTLKIEDMTDEQLAALVAKEMGK